MALFRSSLTKEVGLQLLFCPLSSNIIVRTVCCSVGVALPVYSTFKAIERKDEDEQQKWLMYWAAYGTFSIAEVFADKFLTWSPMHYHLKFAFLVRLQLLSTDGARQLYENYLSPFLVRCQAKADQLRATKRTKFDQLRAIAQAKVDQFRAITLRPFLLTCQAKIDQLRAIEDMVGHISSIKAEIKCGEGTLFAFFWSDPNQPEGRNAAEDLDGVTSATDTESGLEVEETLITHVSSGKFSYSCYEPRTIVGLPNRICSNNRGSFAT